MSTTRWWFTDHALDRFVERILPGATRNEARHALQERATSAVPLSAKTFDGKLQFRADDCVLVADQPKYKKTTKKRFGVILEIITVLFPGEDVAEQTPFLFDNNSNARDAAMNIIGEPAVITLEKSGIEVRWREY